MVKAFFREEGSSDSHLVTVFLVKAGGNKV